MAQGLAPTGSEWSAGAYPLHPVIPFSWTESIAMAFPHTASSCPIGDLITVLISTFATQIFTPKIARRVQEIKGLRDAFA